MTVKRRFTVLVAACLLLPMLLKAQTDSLAFDQGRLRIWCETARFVYEDNGADTLLPSINCQSWESLQSSLRSTDAQLGVLRMMNSVDKPAIYSGFTGTENKLLKLVAEVNDRLKRSPVRRNDARRLDKVDSLSGQLRLIARKADPIAGGASTAANAPLTAQEQAMEDDEALLPPAAYVDDEPKQDMPWNEILQWLALLLIGGFLFWRLRDLEQRYGRLKREFRILQEQVNAFVISNIQPAPVPMSGDSLSEEEVREVVKEELRQNRPAPKPAPANTATSAATTAADATAAIAQAKTQNTQPPPVEQAAAAAASVSVQRQVEAPAANRESTGIYYDKMPFRGGFHQNEMSRERQRDSLYTIRLLQGPQDDAEYWVTEDPEVQRYAMQNGLSFFEEGCEFTEVEENPARVVNEQKGRLRRDGGVWKILQKAKVRFE